MKLIAFIQPFGCNSWREIITGLQQFARGRDWMIQTLDGPPNDSAFRRLLKEWDPDGCIIDCGRRHRSIDDRIIGKLPTVFLNPQTIPKRPRHSCLIHDSESAARMAISELRRLDRPHYAFIEPKAETPWSETRKRIFIEEMSAAGHTPRIIKERRITREIATLPKPCGVFAANDGLACKSTQAARLAGVRIPDELAIVGIDNDSICYEAQEPNITSVQPDFNTAGHRLGILLERAIKNPDAPATTETFGNIGVIRRDTTESRARSDYRVCRALELIRRTVYTENLSVDRIVREMGCSRSLALLRFKEVTGHSIVDEIHELRFQKSCQLLRTSDKPISVVISECGYESESFPKRFFKIRTGLSMRQWRTANRGITDTPMQASCQGDRQSKTPSLPDSVSSGMPRPSRVRG